MELPESDRQTDLYRTDLERHLFALESHRPSESDWESHLARTLGQLLQSLPDVYHDVVRLRTEERLTHNQIADRLDIPLGTVKSRLHRARRTFRRLLEELED